MNSIVVFFTSLIKKIGEASALLNLILVLLICLDVLQRYVLNLTYNWVIELEWHLFGLIFLLGSAYTFQEDKHVRVDLFYNNFSEKKKAWVDTLGTIVLLIPWCIVAIMTSYNYASNSFYIKEGSPNPGGLPAMYLIKFCIVIGFILLLIQALLMIYKNLKILIK